MELDTLFAEKCKIKTPHFFADLEDQRTLFDQHYVCHINCLGHVDNVGRFLAGSLLALLAALALALSGRLGHGIQFQLGWRYGEAFQLDHQG